jgi:hypothetical protein
LSAEPSFYLLTTLVHRQVAFHHEQTHTQLFFSLSTGSSSVVFVRSRHFYNSSTSWPFLAGPRRHHTRRSHQNDAPSRANLFGGPVLSFCVSSLAIILFTDPATDEGFPSFSLTRRSHLLTRHFHSLTRQKETDENANRRLFAN